MSFKRLALGALFLARICAANDSAELQRGASLAAFLRGQQPAQSVTNTATLVIRDADARRSRIPVTIETLLDGPKWLVRYRASKQGSPVALTITHLPDGTLSYDWAANGATNSVAAGDVWRPFLDSDFWIFDFGMEFLHWPQQRVVKQEISNGRPCDILESTNPSTNGGYATVRSAVDVEHKAILSAEAFDSQRRRLKQFAIKGSIEIRGATILGLIMVDDRKGSKSELIPDEQKE